MSTLFKPAALMAFGASLLSSLPALAQEAAAEVTEAVV